MLRPPWVRAVAWFELWGGVWGIIAAALGVYERSGQVSGTYLVVTVLALVFFGTAAFAGYCLAKDMPWGWRLTMPLLLLQVIQFSVAGTSYAAYVGASVTAGIVGWTLQTGGDIGSLFRIRFVDSDSPVGVTVNFVAVAVIILLRRARHRLPSASQRVD
jgi:hypothetical protein